MLFRSAAAFSSYDGDLSLPLGLALGSPIFPSSCEGKLGFAFESLHALGLSLVVASGDCSPEVGELLIAVDSLVALSTSC